MKRFNYPSLLILLIGLIGVSSCGSDDEVENGRDTIQEYIATINTSYLETSSGLYYNITAEGTDPKALGTSFVVFNLRGQLLDGTSIGNTFGSEATFRIDLNQNIIAGLKEALLLLGEGGRGTFILPPSLAFGSAGNGIVPANSPVLYEIEMLDVHANDMFFSDEILTQYAQEQELENLIKTESGLYVLIEEQGNETKPIASSTITIHYEGYFVSGDVFDSSIARESPATLSLTQVIPGWTEGIPYFGEGGKGKLLIPSHLAYGAEGSQSIEGYTPIIFDIELIRVN